MKKQIMTAGTRLYTAFLLMAHLCVAAIAQNQPQAHRDYIEESSRRTLRDRGRELEVTSRHRDNSTAHQRGAIDYRSNNISAAERRAEAQAVSSNLGPGYTAIVEEPHRAPIGPAGQTNTSYRDGRLIRSSVGPDRASAIHTHVQPDAGTPAPQGRTQTSGNGQQTPLEAQPVNPTGNRSSVGEPERGGVLMAPEPRRAGTDGSNIRDQVLSARPSSDELTWATGGRERSTQQAEWEARGTALPRWLFPSLSGLVAITAGIGLWFLRRGR